MKIILLALLIASISGCTINKTAELYPISGPIAKSGVHLPLEATLHDVQRFSGKVDLVLYNGGVCKGRWTAVSPMESGGATIMYGQSLIHSSYSGYSPGVNRGVAMLNCSDGTTIEVEVNIGSGTGSGTGIAVDNKGNTYKVLF